MGEDRTGAQRIADERARHVALGWTRDHDAEHESGELAMAAACYAAAAASARLYEQHTYAASVVYSDPWPFEDCDARPYDGNVLRDATHNEAIRLLEKAGAFIAAEIDRLLHAKGPSHAR